MIRGHVVEEDGKIVGLTLVSRQGTTDSWGIGTVGVLPAYRRRGFARAALETSLQVTKGCGAKETWRSVIQGNAPARALHESLEFQAFGGTFDCTLRSWNCQRRPPFRPATRCPS